MSTTRDSKVTLAIGRPLFPNSPVGRTVCLSLAERLSFIGPIELLQPLVSFETLVSNVFAKHGADPVSNHIVYVGHLLSPRHFHPA
jgi:hypothetical protein